MDTDTDQTPTRRPQPRPAAEGHRAAVVVGALAVLGAAGALVMTLAHLDLGLPLVSDLGPDNSLAPVAAGFGVGTLAYAVVAYGAFARRGWAWGAALALNALALLATLGPPRRPGLFEPAAIAVSLVALAVVLSPAGRRALRRRT